MYHISSLLLLIGVVAFVIILCVAVVSLIRVIIALRVLRKEQYAISQDMENFYKKQLKLLHGKHFLSSLYQYSKLLVELGKGKSVHDIRHGFGFDDTMIQYMENTIMHGKELDYEEENRIKDILHKNID